MVRGRRRDRGSPNEDIPFNVDEASAEALRDLTEDTGALVAGRRLFDIADGWGDDHPVGAPVVVVTHDPPADAAEKWPKTTFVDGVEAAIDRARQIAGDKNVVDRQRERHPAGARPRPDRPGLRQPRAGAVRRGQSYFGKPERDTCCSRTRPSFPASAPCT